VAFDPLAPAPRLPEDLTVVLGFGPSGPDGLGAMLTQPPGGEVTHVSLVQSRTPTLWNGPQYLSRSVHPPVEDTHPTRAEAEAAAAETIALTGD
jgi:hypothetical protein